MPVNASGQCGLLAGDLPTQQRSQGSAGSARSASQVPYAQAVVEAAVEAAAAQWRQALPVLRALQLEPKWLTKQASRPVAGPLSVLQRRLALTTAGAAPC